MMIDNNLYEDLDEKRIDEALTLYD